MIRFYPSLCHILGVVAHKEHSVDLFPVRATSHKPWFATFLVDILACLDDGSLAGATLDVFQTEPLPQASPLWTHPRVDITPHNAAMSAPATIARLVAEQIARAERGEPFQHLVDRSRGY